MEKTVTLGWNEYVALIDRSNHLREIAWTPKETDPEFTKGDYYSLLAEKDKLQEKLIEREDFEAKWHQSETNCKLLQKTIERLEKERLEICKDYQYQIIALEKEIFYSEFHDSIEMIRSLKNKIAELEERNKPLSERYNIDLNIELEGLLKDKERLDYLDRITFLCISNNSIETRDQKVTRSYIDSLRKNEVL